MEYFFSLIALILVVNIKIFKTNTSFFNTALNTLTITGLYATYITGFNSIFIVFLLLLIITHYKKLSISYDKSGLIQSTIYGSLVFIFAYLFQRKIILQEKIPYLDDVFYSRIAAWLHESRTESSVSHISAHLGINVSPKFYHWFEIWLTSFIDRINQGNVYINLYIVVFTLVATISCLALHHIIKELFPNTKKIYIYLLGILSFFIIISINSILDITTLFSSFDASKLISNSSIYNSLKLIFVVPVCFSFYFIATKKENGLFYPILFSFFYLTVFPSVLGVTYLYVLLMFWTDRKFKIEYLFPFLATVLFIGFYFLNSESNSEISKGTSSSSLIPEFSHLFNWFVKAYIINPIGWIIPVYFLFEKKKELKTFGIYFLLIYVCSSGLWLLLYTKLDSHQFFYNIMHPLFSVIFALAILDLIKNKRYVIAFFFGAVSILPLQKLVRSDLSDINRTKLELLQPFLNKKLIYLVHPDKVNTIYKYNEVFYTFNPELFIKNDDIKIMYLNSSYPIRQEFNKEDLNIIKAYRAGNIFFKTCGELDFKDYRCIIDFMKKHGFTTIVSEIEVADSSIYLDEKIEDLYVYQLK